VEKFDTFGIVRAHVPGSLSNQFVANENWVTVSPKKTVKAMTQATPMRNSILNPQVQNELNSSA